MRSQSDRRDCFDCFGCFGRYCYRHDEKEPVISGLADERGFTFQTLIITAVLVLLAVTAGLIFIALTDNSSDDLEETIAEAEARCNSVEIYDPEVAARNEKGKQIAYTNFVHPTQDNPSARDDGNIILVEFEGSAIGCVPVCLWTEPRLDLPVAGHKNRGLQAGEVLFVRDLSQRSDLVINVYKPVLPASERRIYLLAAGSSRQETAYFAKEGGKIIVEPLNDPNATGPGTSYQGTGSNTAVNRDIARIAVAPSGDECHTYDELGDVIFYDAPNNEAEI